MPWNEEPNAQAESPPTPVVKATGWRRSVLSAAMIAGLLAVGGVAAVSAADPSASPAPSAGTSQGADPDKSGTTRVHDGDCPNKGTDDGSGGGTPDASPDASPDTSPDSSNSDL